MSNQNSDPDEEVGPADIHEIIPGKQQRQHATVICPCFNCGKKTPHMTVGVTRRDTGEKNQAMKCAECGALTDVTTGENLEDFQENLDAPNDTDADSSN